MAYSFVQYSAGGSTNQWSVTFPYISRDHVKVYIAGVEDTSKTWVSDTIVQTSSTPTVGTVVEVRRLTPKATPVVDFSDASTLTASNLDAMGLQFLYLTQEAKDAVDNSIQLVSDGTYDALNHRVKNVATPTGSNDAATKAYVDSADAATVAAVSTLASNAAVSAAASAASATASAGSATTSSTQATNSATSATASATSATASATSATASAGSATASAASAAAAAAIAGGASISSLAALTPAADKVPYYTGASSAALATLTSFARSLLASVDAAAARSTLGVDSAVVLYNFANVSVGGTMTANTAVRATAAITHNLPASMTAGQWCVVARNTTAGNVTVGRNSQTIDGVSADFVIDRDKVIVLFICTGAGTIETRWIGRLAK